MNPVRAVVVAVITGSFPSIGFSQTTGSEPAKTIRISARITDETGKALANVTLKCGNANHRENLAVITDANGRFTLSATSHKEYDIYRVEPTVPPFTNIGKFVAAGVQELNLGNLVLRFSSKHESVVTLEGPVSVSGVPSTSRTSSPSIAVLFVGAGGTANIIDDGGNVFQSPKEKDQVDFSSPQISEDRRSIGWLAEFPFCCASYPLAYALVVYTPGQPLRRFTGDGRAIFKWYFVSGGKQVAFLQSFPHGELHEHYELRDVETGRVIDKWDGEPTAKAPGWIQGLRW